MRVATVVCLFVVDTLLSLSYFFVGGCFVVVAAQADALPSTLLWSPLSGKCFDAERVTPPLADTLPRRLWWMLCRGTVGCLSRLVSVHALPPQLHLPC